MAAERDGAIDGLVLIDPTPSGRSFVSEQRAMAAMALGVKTPPRRRLGGDPWCRL